MSFEYFISVYIKQMMMMIKMMMMMIKMIKMMMMKMKKMMMRMMTMMMRMMMMMLKMRKMRKRESIVGMVGQIKVLRWSCRLLDGLYSLFSFIS